MTGLAAWKIVGRAEDGIVGSNSRTRGCRWQHGSRGVKFSRSKVGVTKSSSSGMPLPACSGPGGGANKLRLHVQRGRTRTRNNHRGEGPVFSCTTEPPRTLPPALDPTCPVDPAVQKGTKHVQPLLLLLPCPVADGRYPNVTGGLAYHGEDGRVDGGKVLLLRPEVPIQVPSSMTDDLDFSILIRPSPRTPPFPTPNRATGSKRPLTTTGGPPRRIRRRNPAMSTPLLSSFLLRRGDETFTFGSSRVAHLIAQEEPLFGPPRKGSSALSLRSLKRVPDLGHELTEIVTPASERVGWRIAKLCSSASFPARSGMSKAEAFPNPSCDWPG